MGQDIDKLVDIPLVVVKKSYVSEYPPIVVFHKRNIDGLTKKEKDYLFKVIKGLEEELKKVD